MSDHDQVRVFPPDARRLPDGPATPGMHRLEALAEDGAWLGTVTTEPHTLSGWHHHGDYETYIYVLSGNARLDTFDDGEIRHHDAGPGSFIVVPRGTVHREGSASPTGVEAVLVRVGAGTGRLPGRRSAGRSLAGPEGLDRLDQRGRRRARSSRSRPTHGRPRAPSRRRSRAGPSGSAGVRARTRVASPRR